MDGPTPGERESRIDHLASIVEGYVASHPNASDTVEGIYRWWLADESFEAHGTLLTVALARLVERGVLTKRTLPDGKVIFSSADSAARKDHGPGAR